MSGYRCGRILNSFWILSNNRTYRSFTLYELFGSAVRKEEIMFRDYVCSPANPTTVYVVQQGDTLWRIAGRKLNDTDRWPEIADYNLLKKPYTIFVGQRLYLPKSQSASTPFPALSSTQGDQISCSMPASSDGSESQPAKEVHHASVKLKLDKDVPVLHLKFPGGECEIGFKGELEAFRNSPLPITITRDGVKVEYENSQKAWATPKFVRLFNSLGLSVDKKRCAHYHWQNWNGD